MVKKSKPRDSDSPILFAGISESYLKAFQVLWKNEFETKNAFYWDKSLIFHPVSQLLGVALETSIKGLLVLRNGKANWIHDIEELFGSLDDPILCGKIEQKLQSITVPSIYYDIKKDKDRADVEATHRRHGFHIQLLNRVYDRPFASRYPVLGGHSLPDPVAIEVIIQVLLNELKDETRDWRPQGIT